MKDKFRKFNSFRQTREEENPSLLVGNEGIYRKGTTFKSSLRRVTMATAGEHSLEHSFIPDQISLIDN